LRDAADSRVGQIKAMLAFVGSFFDDPAVLDGDLLSYKVNGIGIIIIG
jgi:hypothetical protein